MINEHDEVEELKNLFNRLYDKKEKNTIEIAEYEKFLSSFQEEIKIKKENINDKLFKYSLQKVISFLFEEVGVNRIEAYHNAKNLASGKVMQKCGMRLEGILRQSYKYKDGISDECIYGILRDDIKNNTSC